MSGTTTQVTPEGIRTTIWLPQAKKLWHTPEISAASTDGLVYVLNPVRALATPRKLTAQGEAA